MPEIQKTENAYDLYMIRSSSDIPSPPKPYAKYVVLNEHREVIFNEEGDILHEMWGIPYEAGENIEFVEDTTNNVTIIKYNGANNLHKANDEEITNLANTGYITPKQMCEFVDNYIETVIKPKIIFEDDEVISHQLNQKTLDE